MGKGKVRNLIFTVRPFAEFSNFLLPCFFVYFDRGLKRSFHTYLSISVFANGRVTRTRVRFRDMAMFFESGQGGITSLRTINRETIFLLL